MLDKARKTMEWAEVQKRSDVTVAEMQMIVGQAQAYALISIAESLAQFVEWKETEYTRQELRAEREG